MPALAREFLVQCGKEDPNWAARHMVDKLEKIDHLAFARDAVALLIFARNKARVHFHDKAKLTGGWMASPKGDNWIPLSLRNDKTLMMLWTMKAEDFFFPNTADDPAAGEQLLDDMLQVMYHAICRSATEWGAMRTGGKLIDEARAEDPEWKDLYTKDRVKLFGGKIELDFRRPKEPVAASDEKKSKTEKKAK